MIKEVRKDWDEFTPQNITEKNIRAMQEQGLDIHRDECDLVDDPDMRKRVLRMHTRKTMVFMGK